MKRPDSKWTQECRIEPAKEHEVSGRIEMNTIQIYDPAEFRSSDITFVRDVETDGDIREEMRWI